MRKTGLKKWTAILMAAAFVLGLGGCTASSSTSNSTDEQPTQTTNDSTASTGEKKVVHIGFTGTGNNWYGGPIGMAQVNYPSPKGNGLTTAQ